MHPTGPHLGPDVLFRESNMKVTLTFNEQRRAAYRQQGLWGDASLADYWQQTARAMPDKIAVVDNHGASYTYSALDHAASCRRCSCARWSCWRGRPRCCWRRGRATIDTVSRAKRWLLTDDAMTSPLRGVMTE